MIKNLLCGCAFVSGLGLAQIAVTAVPHEGMKIPGNVSAHDDNRYSTLLIRQSLIVNDAKCPVHLKDAKIVPVREGERLSYKLSGAVTSNSNDTILAFELHMNLYDPFGLKILDRGLYFPFSVDIRPSETKKLEDLTETYNQDGWLWDVKRMHTCVFYIGNVRILQGGQEKVWLPTDVEGAKELRDAFDRIYPKINSHK